MATITLPDQAYLAECFSYDRDAGELRWRARPHKHFPSGSVMKASNKKYAGRIAGAVDNKGYAHVMISGKNYLTSRIIWKLITGADPSNLIDHKDGDPGNERFDNLREATYRQNAHNHKGWRKTQTGKKGVFFDRDSIIAKIMVDGRERRLGSFPTIESAHRAYCDAAREHFGEFWNPG